MVNPRGREKSCPSFFFLKIPLDKTIKVCYNKDNEREVITMKEKKIDRRMFKKEGEELQQYLHFRKRGSVVKNKKGKGSFNRQKSKRIDNE